MGALGTTLSRRFRAASNISICSGDRMGDIDPNRGAEIYMTGISKQCLRVTGGVIYVRELQAFQRALLSNKL